ncbi:MAG: hydantoinase/oxoprolinase family protein [Acidimicrobiales bacterium]
MSRLARIGIDVGGTNTDAVAVEGDKILASAKRPTTPLVADGIRDALVAILDDAGLEAGEVAAVMVGTTQFVNAVVQASGLARTAVLRLGLPATACLPPLVDWPLALRRALGDHVHLCRGGNEYDGSAIAPLDRATIARIGDAIAADGVESIAITSVFSPMSSELELEAAAILAEHAPQVSVTLSADIGRIGLLERENATVMNACLRSLAADTVSGFEEALTAAGIGGRLFISQNDGTLMSADYARRFPVATFASGPTNSMRGAAFLSGLEDAAVVDIGGTTSDIGVLNRCFPRQAPLGAEIGGVRTNFRMPDVLSLGIGGGSIVRLEGEHIAVGPESVGYELTTRSLAFGGTTLTATDLAVAAGWAELGDPDLLSGLGRSVVRNGLLLVERALAEAVDRMKTSPGEVPVVVVGGGGLLLEQRLPGASRLVRPEHGEVANAVGAAMAQIGGEVDRIVHADEAAGAKAIGEVVEEATERAVAAGAEPGTVEVVEIDKVPISYLPGNAVRVRAKAVGNLRLEMAT